MLMKLQSYVLEATKLEPMKRVYSARLRQMRLARDAAGQDCA
jgi:hypothetical protein